MNGWMGSVLRVNLTDGKITKEPLDRELACQYVGGRGLNLKLLYDEVKPMIDPFGPENKVIFGVGPACGTLVPSNQRWTVTTKSPLSGFIGDGNCGGTLGIGFKYAGYDIIIIEGKSDRPLYLWIDDDHVQLRDAAHLWGKKTTETEMAIRREIGSSNVHIASIGPAGENLVRFAAVMSECRAVGRCGIGAVLGSKRLKAIVARGSKGVRVADLDRVQKVSRKIFDNWHENAGGRKAVNEIGPGVEAGRFYQEYGILPTYNYREGVFKEYDAVHPDRIKEYYVRPTKTCFSCPVACKQLYVVPKGPYAGTFGEGLHAGAMNYTSKLGMTDLEFMFRATTLSDQYGVDVMDMSSVLGWLMECYEYGIVTSKELGGLKMEWGNSNAALEMIEMIVHRKGIGNLLAEGARKASEAIGRGSEKYVMDVKGLGLDSRDPRGSKGWALGYAVSSRGADHCRHLMLDFTTGRSKEPSWLKEEIKGFKGLDRLSEEGKAEIYKYYEDVRAFQNCLEVCCFAFESKDVAWNKVLAEMYNSVTGLDLSANDVMTIGERVVNLERVYNLREGLTRKDDSLPDRFLKEPMEIGASEGQVVDLDVMIDEYYELRGWEKESGLPKRERLEQLGLKDVAKDILSEEE
jgi:aldehyde:ferredoxin oxidoreductase